MLDPWIGARLKKPLENCADRLKTRPIQPDQVTLAGFGLGVLAFLLIWAGWYRTGWMFLMMNRILDGLDGALARKTRRTDAGGFLDICLDFIFYAGMVTGFALADPKTNALAAAILLFGFFGTGTSFLAFSIMAEKHGLKSMAYSHKSIYYMGGLTEGTETILFFTFVCFFPDVFPAAAGVFTILCLITTLTRITIGYRTLKQISQDPGTEEP